MIRTEVLMITSNGCTSVRPVYILFSGVWQRCCQLTRSYGLPTSFVRRWKAARDLRARSEKSSPVRQWSWKRRQWVIPLRPAIFGLIFVFAPSFAPPSYFIFPRHFIFTRHPATPFSPPLRSWWRQGDGVLGTSRDSTLHCEMVCLEHDGALGLVGCRHPWAWGLAVTI
ncbi:hypothetical protein BV22DRAFT_863565 [Leucogyrophana mollusca]|uniref:Uncharacterized protein n=1 Tax=Leucogyrophana mollusca TaxID=85980 RepID=A0ACB8B3S6_9AGAM|nr:hypothetical protein BV22DRAFT_863565 [Leucogyrophana mollusca]